jgi:hypothetical protein
MPTIIEFNYCVYTLFIKATASLLCGYRKIDRAGSYEDGNEPSGCTKRREISYYLIDH